VSCALSTSRELGTSSLLLSALENVREAIRADGEKTSAGSAVCVKVLLQIGHLKQRVATGSILTNQYLLAELSIR
jgi:hypothetical protein